MKLDLGCGKNKRDGFIGVDQFAMPGVDVVANLRERWPWEDDSVDEVHCSHFLEHLEARERVHFANELWRVLKVKPAGMLSAQCTIVVPHYNSSRAIGDMTHRWPPVCDFWCNYLWRKWRLGNAPHDDVEFNPDGYSCNFEFGTSPVMSPELQSRNPEYQQFAARYLNEAASDLVIYLNKMPLDWQGNG